VDDHQRDGLAGAPVGDRGGAGEPPGQQQQEREREQRDGRERRVEHEQHDGHRDDREAGQHQVVDAPVDQLGDRVHVAGEPGDHAAGRVALVEADRQPLEVVVHPLPQLAQHRLADPGGQGEEPALAGVLDDRGRDERHADRAQHPPVAVVAQGWDALVDRQHHEERPGHAGGALHQQEDDRDAQQALVRAQHRSQQRPAQAAEPGHRDRVAGLGHRTVRVGVGRPATPGSDVRAPLPGNRCRHAAAALVADSTSR
jgi:hypothetical protein